MWKSVGAWAAGILATVISAVLVYHFTQSTPQPSPVPQVQIQGNVLDASSNRLLEGARVEVVVNKSSVEQSTTADGSYGFTITGVDPQTMGQVTVTQAGYKPGGATAPLQDLGFRNYALEPLAASQPAPALPGGLAAKPQFPAGSHPYVKRPDFKMLQVKPQK